MALIMVSSCSKRIYHDNTVWAQRRPIAAVVGHDLPLLLIRPCFGHTSFCSTLAFGLPSRGDIPQPERDMGGLHRLLDHRDQIAT